MFTGRGKRMTGQWKLWVGVCSLLVLLCAGDAMATQALCESTGGSWDQFSCGHYQCGEPSLCLAIIPGCDCGETANFVEGYGCKKDPICGGDSNEPSDKSLCEDTGGTWDF